MRNMREREDSEAVACGVVYVFITNKQGREIASASVKEEKEKEGRSRFCAVL